MPNLRLHICSTTTSTKMSSRKKQSTTAICKQSMESPATMDIIHEIFESEIFLNKVECLAKNIAKEIINQSYDKLLGLIEHNESRLHDVEIKVVEKERELVKIQQSIDSHSQKLSNLENSIDHLEQYSRRSCLRIFGVKETADENTDDIACDIANKNLGVSLARSDIDRSHRTGKVRQNYKHPRSIIVKFTSYRKRTEFLKARRKLKQTGITVQEDLTSKNQLLYKKTYESKKVESAWTLDGNIFALVKATGGKTLKKLIRSIQDLESL